MISPSPYWACLQEWLDVTANDNDDDDANDNDDNDEKDQDGDDVHDESDDDIEDDEVKMPTINIPDETTAPTTPTTETSEITGESEFAEITGVDGTALHESTGVAGTDDESMDDDLEDDQDRI